VKRASLAAADRSTPLLARRTRQFRSEIKGAFAGDEDAIHELRIAARRLRAALPVLADKPESRHVRRARRLLRRLTRAFGESRDLDVGLPLLEARAKALGSSRELRALVSSLRRARKEAQRRMQRAIAEFDIDELRHELRTLADRVADDGDALARLRAERARRGRNLLARLRTAHAHTHSSDAAGFDAEALHTIRIRARRLRYVAETLDTLRGHNTRAPALFKELQDELGSVHDAHVLGEWLGAQAAAFEAEKERATAAQARALARFFAQQAEKQHREFMATAPITRVRRALAIMRANEILKTKGAA
jgi:CHAD domain-containing protein